MDSLEILDLFPDPFQLFLDADHIVKDRRVGRLAAGGIRLPEHLLEEKAQALADRHVSVSVRKSRGATTSPRSRGNSDAAVIRAWAKQNGQKVSERGRVSAQVRAAAGPNGA